MIHQIIKQHSQSLEHVSIIDINPRGNKERKQELKDEAKRCNLLNFKKPSDTRYNERSNVERVNGRLKDEFGGKMVRVRGHAKAMTHLMFIKQTVANLFWLKVKINLKNRDGLISKTIFQ